MGYKYSTGSVRRGDIYYEDDRDGAATYINFGQDSIAFETSGSARLTVANSVVTTTVPIHISGSSTEGLRIAKGSGDYREIQFETDGTDTAYIMHASDGSLQIGCQSNNDEIQFFTIATGESISEAMRITADNKVGINTDDPDYTLDVAGNIGLDEYIYHNGDADTFIRFQADDIVIKAGGVNCISFTSASQSKLICNDGAEDLDFIVRSPNQSLALYLNAGNEVFHINHGETDFKTKIHSTNGEAITVNSSGVILNEDGHATNDFRVESDNQTHMLFVDGGNDKIGIGTSSPASPLHVYGNLDGTYVATIDNDESSNGHVLKLLTDGNGSGTKVLEMVDGDGDTIFRARADGRFGFGPDGVDSMGAGTFVVGIDNSSHTSDIAISARLQHLGDGNTYLDFPANDQMQFQVGGVDMIHMTEDGTQDMIVFNEGSGDVDFRIESDGDTHAFFVDSGNDVVGIRTSSPTATLHVSGSYAGHVTSVTSSPYTVAATDWLLVCSADVAKTINLPAVADNIGRILHIKDGGANANSYNITLDGNSSETIDGSTTHVINQDRASVTIVSTGSEWVLISVYSGPPP